MRVLSRAAELRTVRPPRTCFMTSPRHAKSDQNSTSLEDSIRGFSKDAVLRALEENLWEMWSNFGRGPSCTLHDEGDALWFDTPIPSQLRSLRRQGSQSRTTGTSAQLSRLHASRCRCSAISKPSGVMTTGCSRAEFVLPTE